jgi:hypothetical protein
MNTYGNHALADKKLPDKDNKQQGILVWLKGI